MHARPGATGGIPGPCPPKWLLVPPKRKLCHPKRGLCPKEINKLGATGVKIEAQIGVYHRYFRNFCGLTPDFMTFLGWRPFFFLLEITCFRPEKNVWISDFSRKIPLNFWSALCSFDPDWDKFLVSPCPSGIHINKLLVSPKIYFWPPSHAILTQGRIHHLPVLQK